MGGHNARAAAVLRVQVAPGPVHIAQRLRVVGEIRRLENGPGRLLQAHEGLVDLDPFQEVVGREDRVALEVHRPHFVLLPLGNINANNHPLGIDVIKLDVLDGKIYVAFVLEKLHQQILVVLKIVRLQHARSGQPGKHPAAARVLEHFAQGPLGGGVGIHKNDVLDLDLGHFVNRKGGRPASGRLIDHRGLDRDGGFLVAGLFVHFLDRLGVVEKFPFVQRLALLGSDFLLDLFEAHFVVPHNPKLGQDRFALHDVGHVQAPGVQVHRDIDLEEIARGVEVLDILIRRRARERVSRLDADVGADEFLAHGRRADEADRDFIDNQPGLLSQGRRQTSRQPGPDHKRQRWKNSHCSSLGRHILHAHFGRALETSVALEERQIHVPSGAVALFGNVELHGNGVLLHVRFFIPVFVFHFTIQ